MCVRGKEFSAVVVIAVKTDSGTTKLPQKRETKMINLRENPHNAHNATDDVHFDL